MPGGGANPGGRPCGSGGMPVECQHSSLKHHEPAHMYTPAGNPGGIPPGGIGNPGGRPAGGTMPPGGPNPGGAVFSIGLFADCPSAAYEFVMLSMTLCAFSCPICW